ncbi:glycosyltransferase family 2 protein [Nodosilinea sp. LEGE 07088]|uniref:glycosyltransferase n=1 Tax=Nodosilinea sp. LEGE 07088 TaxID=2777968 RepID=UPI001D134326|nr:glycosyltransferase [Nodosilinea sp. LEGE 07088]
MVSVIVPVFNDAERLKICLTALDRQTYPRACYEIMVVDNGSDDVDMTRAVVALSPNARLAIEPRPGSYAARNRGLALTTGEVLAFTDADCVPAEDWLQRGVAQLQRLPDGGQVVGRIETFFPNPDRPTPVDLYESITAFPQEALLRQFHGGATANMFTWRQVFDRVGGFNAQLKSHGDLEWGHRVYSLGYPQVYAESVVVRHPTRSSYQGLIKRTQRLAGGSYALHAKQAKTRWQKLAVFWRALAQNLVPPVFFAVNAIFDCRLQGIGQKLQVPLVLVLVRAVSAVEVLRLGLGGTPCRD